MIPVHPGHFEHCHQTLCHPGHKRNTNQHWFLANNTLLCGALRERAISCSAMSSPAQKLRCIDHCQTATSAFSLKENGTVFRPIVTGNSLLNSFLVVVCYAHPLMVLEAAFRLKQSPQSHWCSRKQ